MVENKKTSKKTNTKKQKPMNNNQRKKTTTKTTNKKTTTNKTTANKSNKKTNLNKTTTNKSNKKINPNKSNKKTSKPSVRTNKINLIKTNQKETPKILKTKPAKSKTKKNEINNSLAYGAILVLILLVVSIFYFGFIHQPYKYQFSVDNSYSKINYYSNIYTPSEFAGILKEQKTVYVSPEFEKTNRQQVNAMNLWQVVLISKGKEVVQLIQVLDNGELAYCQTNFGDVLTSEVLTKEECLEILNNKDNFFVFIKEGNERTILNKNSVEIYSQSQDTSFYNFAVITEIYLDAAEQITKINEMIYGIN